MRVRRGPGVDDVQPVLGEHVHELAVVFDEVRLVDPAILESNLSRRVNIVWFMVEDLKNAEPMHEAAAIVGRQGASARVHTAATRGIP